MADVVQMNMERMIPELEDLQEREIFSKGEIKKIVKQRRDFEYRVQRKSPNKLDFLRYIEFEMNLDLLLRKRKQRLNIVKSSKHDFGSIKRVSLIYNNALRRFPNDLALWYQYLDHLESQRSAKALRGAYPKALQLFPREARIWVRAAAFEFSIQKDIAAARVMMQRGLRINDDSELLWVSFFTMEIRYVQKLLARRRAMGFTDHSAAGGVEGALSPKEAEFLKGALPRAIHRNCMSKPKLSGSLSLHLQFLQAIPKPTPIFTTKRSALDENKRHITGYRDPFRELREEILQGLREKLGHVEEDAWVAVALEALRAGERDRLIPGPKKKTRLSSERRAFAVYERAIESLPTAKMYMRYAEFLRERLGHDRLSEKAKQEISRRLLDLFRRAVAAQKSGTVHAGGKFAISPRLYLIWADSLIRLGLPLEAAEILKQSTEEYVTCPGPWIRLAELSMRGIYPTKTTKNGNRKGRKKISFFEEMVKDSYVRTVSTLEKGLRSVPAKDSKPLWLRLLFLHTAQHMHDSSEAAASRSALEKTFKSAFASLGTSAAPELAIAYLDWCVVSNGASLARISAAVRTILGYGSSASLEVHMRCLEALACAQPPASTKDISLASEKSIDRFGEQSVELWLWLARWEMRRCDSDGAAAAAKIAWRAEKVLKETSVKSEFRRRYRDMVGEV